MSEFMLEPLFPRFFAHLRPTVRAARILGAAALLCAGVPASAQVTIPNGRLLASNCFQCHGTNGRGPGFDSLAGKPASELFRELKEFQTGEEGGGLMGKHAWGYTDAQLQALSQYLSRQR
jgi:cytochrome subunit of sulfide dehydrogenase